MLGEVLKTQNESLQHTCSKLFLAVCWFALAFSFFGWSRATQAAPKKNSHKVWKPKADFRTSTLRRNVRRMVAQNRKNNTIIRARKGCRVNWRVRVLANFEKASLLTVVKWIAKQTCQNFILSSRVRSGQMHIISRTKVSLRAAYRAFFTALQANGFTAFKRGTFWKIINARTSRQNPIRTIINRKNALPYRDEMVTYMHKLKHLSATQVVGTIRYLSSSSGGIIPYQPSSVLIITDYSTNIRRILKVLKALDIPQAETRDNIYVLQIQHAQAQNIAAKFQQLFQIGQRRRTIRRYRRYRRRRKYRRTSKQKANLTGDASRITKMIADERTNQIVLLCNPRALKRVSKLLKDLDVALPGDGQIRVHYLKYANSDELAQVLSLMTKGTRTQTRRRRYRRKTRRKKASELFEGQVQITSDKSTNSLVIVASRRDYESLVHVINKLDVARKQVFIEIAILEVSMKKSNELGLTFHHARNVTGDNANPTLGILGTALGGLSSLTLDPTALMGLAFGLRGASVPNSSGLLGNPSAGATTGGIALGVPSFGVLLRAIQTDTDVDIVSTPHILTTANKEATIQVGQNVPFIAGTTFTGAATAGVPAIRNVQRQDVALTVKVKPQVNKGSFIRLDFEQELTELAEQNPELGPTTTKRKIKTVIIAKNRQTVVIGGLVRSKVTNSISKVPFLGDIPLLGALFRVTRKEREKRNLLVFLTPYIIESSRDFQQIFEEKMKERKQFIKLFYRGKSRYKVPNNRNYSRSVGLFETIQRSMKRTKKQAIEMQKQNIKPVSLSKKKKAAHKKKTTPSNNAPTPVVPTVR